MSPQENKSEMRARFEKAFNYPANQDVVFRDFKFLDRDGFLVYIDGMAGGDKISQFILRPILYHRGLPAYLKDVLPVNDLSETADFDQAVSAVLQGDCVVYADGEPGLSICETKNFEKRGVEKPQIENSIMGAQEAFSEAFRTNTTLLRRIIKNSGLTTETVTVGKMGNLTCGVMYLSGLANQEIVDEVKRRLEGLDTDFVQSSGMVEQFIQDQSHPLFQTIIATERPDNAAALIMQGRVAVIVDGSSRVIIAPITLFSILKTSGESALGAPLASAVRAIRMLAIFTALLMPALYLAITTFHPDMLPTALLLLIARGRLGIPYPAMVELLLMEIAFELIREAGERIPGMLGGTIGIVGGLILGEAAISAGLVSQGCVVVIAVTALGNFAIPQYPTAYTARLLRIAFILCAGFLGFFGIGAAFAVLVGYLYSLTSLGTDYLAPAFSGSASMFPKKPVWKYETRPPELRTGRPRYQPEISRRWKKKDG